MKVLIYSSTLTTRLQYICNFIFNDLMGSEFFIITNIEIFKNSDDVKINYSNGAICENELHILPVDLLFENNIAPQIIDSFEVNNYKAFFKTGNAAFPFDFFAASFYLLTRYEEYLPHTKDMYGRYACENSIAFKEGFLHLPIINIWTKYFLSSLQKKFYAFTIPQKKFTFLPTYDIDIAWCYKHKGLLRNLGGFLKKPSLKRLKVLSGLSKDPFDVYERLNALHEKFQLKPLYFFLVAAQNSLYDKNILPVKKAMRQLIKLHAKRYKTALHPSWQSGDDDSLLQKEKEQLQMMIKKAITASRQHYIRFNLPQGYRRLINLGITNDYSMGYGSINGFRASAASSFYWYDLEAEQETQLRVNPFCYMDANSFYEQKFTPTQAYKELLQYYKVCQEVDGTLITIWHNNIMGAQKLFQGWGNMYEHFLENHWLGFE